MTDAAEEFAQKNKDQFTFFGRVNILEEYQLAKRFKIEKENAP